LHQASQRADSQAHQLSDNDGRGPGALAMVRSGGKIRRRPPGALLSEAAALDPLTIAGTEPSRVGDLRLQLDLGPPPGLPLQQSPPKLGLSFDADGIARLVAPATSPPAAAEGLPAVSLASCPAGKGGGTDGGSGCSTAQLRNTAVEHSGADGVALATRIREVLVGAGRAVIHVTGHCSEAEPLEISSGEVSLQGCVEGSGKARLVLPGVRVTGGSLRLDNMELCASEENRVRAGELRCTDCFITSRNGCGVLCLQGANVFLTGCEVAHCMRSGVGVNGKNAELHLSKCVIERNNFSGLGINHQARRIQLTGNRITGNGYHGIWLNVGVVANWVSGDLSGNRLSDKDGPGTPPADRDEEDLRPV